MAKVEDQWRALAKALGDAIKSRRKALQHPPEHITSEVGLSASYYRSIEAGSTVPPPSIAMPLAKALGWDPARTSELLCAIAYLRGPQPEAVVARRIWLTNNAVAPGILALSERRETAAAISDYLSSSSSDAGDHLVGASKPGQKYPWMVGLAVQRMINDLSSIPFTVNIAYMVEFEGRHAQNITEAVAILSYVPTGLTWLHSPFSFGFMRNKFAPKFTVKFPVTDRRTEIVQSELVDALTSKLVKAAKDKVELRAALESKLVAYGRDVSPDQARNQFRFDLLNNSLLDSQEGSSSVQAFHNAWLYKIGADGTWVGFLDNFDPNYPDRELVLAPLAIEDARRLAAGV